MPPKRRQTKLQELFSTIPTQSIINIARAGKVSRLSKDAKRLARHAYVHMVKECISFAKTETMAHGRKRINQNDLINGLARNNISLIVTTINSVKKKSKGQLSGHRTIPKKEPVKKEDLQVKSYTKNDE